MPHPCATAPRLERLLPILILVAAAACDEPTAPTSTDAGALSFASTNTATTYPNSRRYRDAGAHPAVGRSGGAEVHTRSLLYASGRTFTDVATGGIDEPSTHRGVFERVQFKVFDPSGALVRVRNFNEPTDGAQLRFFSDAAPRGTPLQVQANVGGLPTQPDDERTAVVTVQDVVRLAPDLVPSLGFAPEAYVGLPVNIEATVREQNGEVGARADCVLLVDGEFADATWGIWVDAGDAVACVFTAIFATPGRHHFDVRVVGVRPQDYDARNNGVRGEIDVLAESPVVWNASAYDTRSSAVMESSGSWAAVGGPAGMEWSDRFSSETHSQGASVSGFGGALPAFPAVPLRDVVVAQSTGGALVDHASYASLEPDFVQSDPGGATLACVSRGTEERRAWFGFCASTSFANGVPYGSLSFFYERYSGTVAYRSERYERVWDHSVPFDEYYTYNNEFGWADGMLVAYGDSYALDVTFTDGVRRYEVVVSMVLQAFADRISEPRTCFDWQDAFNVNRFCTAREVNREERIGYASGLAFGASLPAPLP